MIKEPKGNAGRGKCIDWIRAHADYQGDECIIWPYSRHPTGYGAFGYFGEQHYAHRFMCEVVNGPPPTSEHEAAHSCGNGKGGCCTPKHLSWKTISENNLDCRTHGTQSRNPWGRTGRLVDGEIRAIKVLKGILTQAKIAALFGISGATVRDIHSGRSHADVSVGQSADKP